MRSVICWALALSLFAANSAWATPATHHTARHVRARSHPIRIMLRRGPPAHHMSPLALAGANQHAAPITADGSDMLPGSDHPSWLRDRYHAGWGWREGRSETVMGLYRRPAPPILPGPDIIQEGPGAAGVSMSIKLGH